MALICTVIIGSRDQGHLGHCSHHASQYLKSFAAGALSITHCRGSALQQTS